MNKPIVNEYNAEALEEIAQEEIKDDDEWGFEAQIDLHDCDPEIIRDFEKVKQYVIELCDLIEMRRFGECTVVHFGEDEKVAGISFFQLIETSCISGHLANATNRAFINIFSCKKYNEKLAAEFTKEFFKAGKINKLTLTSRK